MVSLLRSGSVKTRFTALLTLGLSAVVYSAQPPALHAGVAPVYVVLGLSGLTDAQVARFFPSGVYPKILEGSLQRYNTHQSQAEIDLITTNTALNRLSSGVILGHDEMLKLHIILGL